LMSFSSSSSSSSSWYSSSSSSSSSSSLVFTVLDATARGGSLGWAPVFAQFALAVAIAAGGLLHLSQDSWTTLHW
jgi:hypothetical protein